MNLPERQLGDEGLVGWWFAAEQPNAGLFCYGAEAMGCVLERVEPGFYLIGINDERAELRETKSMLGWEFYATHKEAVEALDRMKAGRLMNWQAVVEKVTNP